jgi:iron complex outermembrane recepter protein
MILLQRSRRYTLSVPFKGLNFSFFPLVLWLSVAAVVPAYGVEDGSSAEVLDLPLERLMDVSVVSASRKSQTLSDVSSAVFVINQEDIRHSGATTIPDLLRMVPGVQVASIDGHSWAVSIRGFNGNFANKLLVMIDGRSVYTPMFGGVFWDVQDTMFDNIERIEVIRGSGSTMWGANAVNGVINIITKNSQDTKGGLVTGLAGTGERASVEARYGAALSDSANYRIYLKHVDRDNTMSSTPGAEDFLRITRGGFRVDSAPADGFNLTLQGDAYGGSEGNTFNVPSFSAPYLNTLTRSSDLSGANILSRLDWLQSESSKVSLQLYYDRTNRDTRFYREYRDTADIDLQHNIRIAGNHELTWGAGFRFLHDRTPGSDVFHLTPENRSDSLLNLFAQDEITLWPDTLRFILGSKLEHNEFSGWELEPSAKLSWTPRKGYSIWASVARSVRTPSRAEQDMNMTYKVSPPTPQIPLPSVVVRLGDRAVGAEALLAYELGFRADLSDILSVDFSSFYNQYRSVIDSAPAPLVPGATQLTIPFVYRNLYHFDSTGAELSLQLHPREWWKIKAGYSYIRFLGDETDTYLGVKATPAHQATVRSLFSIGRDIDLDIWARYVGANSYPLYYGTVEIPAYTALDTRLAWRPMAGVELSLVGKNLLQRHHLETITDLSLVRHETERSLYGQVSWAF